MEDKIVEFINRRFGNTDAHWLTGNCYYMALIICSRFPECEIYYDPLEGHFLAGTDGKFYDATGLRARPRNGAILFSDLEEEDPKWFDRIIKNCID